MDETASRVRMAKGPARAMTGVGGGGRAAPPPRPSFARLAAALAFFVSVFQLQSAPPAPVVLSGPEVARLDWGARSLQAADMDGDGLLDLIVVNNDRATIDILYQRKPGGPSDGMPRPFSRNRWEPVLEDSRFRKDSVVAGITVFDLAAGDLNGDGLADLAYAGTPQALTVRLQQKDGAWTEWKIADAPAANQLVGSLKITDLDGDGRNELVLLGQKELAIFRGFSGNRSDPPERHMLPDDNSHGLEFCDLNGDGLTDIVYLCGNPRVTMRARMQTGSRRFGPELTYEIKPSRCTLQILARAAGGRPASFAMARDGTGQMEEFALRPPPPAPGAPPSLRPRVFSPRPGAKAPFAFVSGRFTGAGAGPDIAVSDPDGAQVLLYPRQHDGGFTVAEKFPSFAEGRAIAAGDWDGDGRDELFVGSAREQAVGVARFSDGRLSYPQPLPVTGRPLDLAFGDIAGDGRGILAVLLEDAGRRRIELWARKGDADAERIGAIELTGLKTDPRALRLVDANQDGLLDIAVFTPLDSMRLFTQNAGIALGFAEASAAAGFRRGLVDKIEASAFAAADIDGDGRAEMIVSSGGFARALRLGGGDHASLTIIDQFNAAPGADITAALVLPSGPRGGGGGSAPALPLVVLYDRRAGEFQLLRVGREGGVYAAAGTVKAGRIDITGVEVAACDAGGAESFVYGKDRFWWLPANQPDLVPATLSTHTTDLPEVSYADVVAGDLNNDGRPELVCIDPIKNVIEILARENGGQWKSMLHFKVFETDEHFQGQGGASFEPRETVIADVTGDGKNDLVVLVHDRVLVYPQD